MIMICKSIKVQEDSSSLKMPLPRTYLILLQVTAFQPPPPPSRPLPIPLRKATVIKDQEAKRLKNSGSSLDWNFSRPPRFFLLSEVPMRWRCMVAAGSRSRVVTLMKESSSTLCMSSPPSVEDFFLKRREDLEEPGRTSGFCSASEWISMLFWYLSLLLLRGRSSSPRAARGPSSLALQILLLGVMKTSRLRDTSGCFGRTSFLLFIENSRQLSSMSSGGAGSIADSFLRRVEAALRLMLCSDSLILFTTLEDCILQPAVRAQALMDQQQRQLVQRKGNATYVVLNNCLIGDEGVAWLCEGDHPSKHLWLKANNIGPEGSRHLKRRFWNDLLLISLCNFTKRRRQSPRELRVQVPKQDGLRGAEGHRPLEELYRERGVSHVSKAQWPCLRRISLGNRAGVAAQGRWLRETGLTWHNCNSPPMTSIRVSQYSLQLLSFSYRRSCIVPRAIRICRRCLPRKRSTNEGENDGSNFYKLTGAGIQFDRRIASYNLFLLRSIIRAIMTERKPAAQAPLPLPIPPKGKASFRTAPFHESGEVNKNQMGVHALYRQILRDYVRRLAERSEKNPRPFANEEEVNRFDSAIKYYYNHSTASYALAIRKHQTGRSLQWAKHEQKHEESEKYEYLDDDEEDEEETAGQDQQQNKNQQFKLPNLFHYRPPEAKMEEPALRPVVVPCAKAEDETSSNSGSESEDIGEYACAAERRTNCLIFGNFVTNKIKRKPKEEKMFVELHNIFIKFAHNSRDAFYDRGTLEFRKIEKAEVPLQ